MEATGTPPSRRIFNIAANFAAAGWGAFLQLALVPVYLHLLGKASYGIVGFYATLQASLQILDLGLSPALNREMARRSSGAVDCSDTALMLRTLETVYLGIGLVLGLGIWLAAPLIAQTWLRGGDLPVDEVIYSIRLMGFAFAAQWPATLYTGGLLGLQRQVTVAIINVSSVTAFALVIFTALSFRPEPHLVFTCRAATSLATILLLRYYLWQSVRRITPAAKTGFQLSSLSVIRSFSTTMAGVALTGIIIIQFDKVLVSRVVVLERFGEYMLASTAAMGIPLIIAPIFAAMLPPIAQAVARGSETELRANFHSLTRLISAIAWPPALILLAFPRYVLEAWTGNPSVAVEASGFLRLFAAGYLLNSMVAPIYAVQIGAAKMRQALLTNVAILTVGLPYTYLAARTWGASGAASGWVLTNSIYFLLAGSLVLPSLLPGEVRTWLLHDFARPLAWVLPVLGLGQYLLPRFHAGRIGMAFELIGLAFIGVVGATMMIPELNARVLGFLRTNRSIMRLLGGAA